MVPTRLRRRPEVATRLRRASKVERLGVQPNSSSAREERDTSLMQSPGRRADLMPKETVNREDF